MISFLPVCQLNLSNRIGELFEDIEVVLPKILESHQISERNVLEYLKPKPAIEGADVIQNLPESLSNITKTIAAHVGDSLPELGNLVEELTKHLHFIEMWIMPLMGKLMDNLSGCPQFPQSLGQLSELPTLPTVQPTTTPFSSFFLKHDISKLVGL